MADDDQQHDKRITEPEEVTYVWDEIVSCKVELRNGEVTRIVTVKLSTDEKQTEYEFGMEDFHHSTALQDILDVLIVNQPDDPDNEEVQDWIESLEIIIPSMRAEEEINERTLMLTPDQYAFCCAVCRCPKEKQSTHVITGGDNGLWHRFCCHNIKRCTKKWRSPTEVALEEIAPEKNQITDNVDPVDDSDPVSILGVKTWNLDQVIKKSQIAKALETKLNNATVNVDPMLQWRTNSVNSDNARKFEDLKRKIRNPKRKAAVVVDLFGGMGTFLVAMKQLGISIKKVVHVEHDFVASHVTKFNHKNDGIKHIFIEKFESIRGPNFVPFMKRIADPIDIIVGGPPCQDYSKVNAARAGVAGQDGKYMKMTGKFITHVQRYQNRFHHGHPVHYLIENVVLGGEDLQEICVAFENVTPINVDSYYFSPCKRNRGYFLNFQVEVSYGGGMAEQSKCDDCLDDEFLLSETLVQKESETPSQNSSDFWSKANTFMASKVRLDDIRMMAVKKSATRGEFLVRAFTVTERERMLGLPDGYVSQALSSLFKALTPVSLMIAQSELSEEREESWQTMLDECYHCFAGRPYRFRITPKLEPVLMHAPPLNNSRSNPCWYTEEEYGKRLIGNAVSVSVIAILLQPLTAIFDKASYKGYPFQYGWDTTRQPLSESIQDDVENDSFGRMHSPESAPDYPNDTMDDDDDDDNSVSVRNYNDRVQMDSITARCYDARSDAKQPARTHSKKLAMNANENNTASTLDCLDDPTDYEPTMSSGHTDDTNDGDDCPAAAAAALLPTATTTKRRYVGLITDATNGPRRKFDYQDSIFM